MHPIRRWQANQSTEGASAPRTPPRPENVYTPALDIHETSEGLVVVADLPGVPSDQLEVRVEQNVLTIYGKVTWPVPEGAHLLYEEVRPGDYYRSFILSEEVDTEKISADFSQGVLRLVLPKAAKARPRKIEVRNSSVATP